MFFFSGGSPILLQIGFKVIHGSPLLGWGGRCCAKDEQEQLVTPGLNVFVGQRFEHKTAASEDLARGQA